MELGSGFAVRLYACGVCGMKLAGMGACHQCGSHERTAKGYSSYLWTALFFIFLLSALGIF